MAWFTGVKDLTNSERGVFCFAVLVLAGLLTALSVPIPEAIVLGVTGLYVGAKAATSAVETMGRSKVVVEEKKGEATVAVARSAGAAQVAVAKETGSPAQAAPVPSPPMPLPAPPEGD